MVTCKWSIARAIARSNLKGLDCFPFVMLRASAHIARNDNFLNALTIILGIVFIVLPCKNFFSPFPVYTRTSLCKFFTTPFTPFIKGDLVAAMLRYEIDE